MCTPPDTPPQGPAPGSSTAGSTSRSPFHLRLAIHRRAPLPPALNVRSWGSARGRLSVGSANPGAASHPSRMKHFSQSEAAVPSREIAMLDSSEKKNLFRLVGLWAMSLKWREFFPPLRWRQLAPRLPRRCRATSFQNIAAVFLLASWSTHYAILSASTHQLPQSKYARFTLTHDLTCSNNVTSSPSLYTWQYR